MSNSKDFESFHAPQGLHHLLAAGVPALCVAVILYDVISPWPWAVAVVLAVQGLVVSAWAQWSATTRLSPLIKFWFWLALQGLVFALMAVVATNLWWQWGLVATAQGQLTAFWQSQLAARARLFYKIEGVEEGKSLEARVHDFQLDADFSPSNRKALLGSLAVMAVAVIGVSTATERGHVGLGLVLTVGFVMLVLVVVGLTGLYRREMVAFMYGRRLSGREKLIPLVTIVLLAVASGLLSWWTISQLPVLVDWRQALSGRPLPVIDLPPVPVQPPIPGPMEIPSGELLPALWLAWWLQVLHFQRIFDVLDLTIRAAVIGIPLSLLVWMLWPLVRLLGPDRPKTKGLFKLWWKLLVEQWRDFWRRLGVLTRDPLSWGDSQQSLTTPGPQAWLRSLAARWGGRRGPVWPPLIAAFVELMEWARPQVEYHAGETTGSYCRRLAEGFPQHGAALGQVASALERELFSKTKLSDLEREQFLAAIRSIVVSSKDAPAP